MSPRLRQVKTYFRLGLKNVARVAFYRLGLRSGLHPVQRISADIARGPFFRRCQDQLIRPLPNDAWNGCLWWFGWSSVPLSDDPPNWFSNPFSDIVQPKATQDWWRIPDFGSGDIKGVWEFSRMDWAVAWATSAANGDEKALARLNQWVADWAAENPPYKGPNWKCGQEASIRVMHLVTAAWVLGQSHDPEPGLVQIIRAHLQRIAPTISYAIGQQNNHGTSEAAALFIGGSFLSGHDSRAGMWQSKGRIWLERLAGSSIEPDGCFSQYSVIYHRLMLDTFSLAESWRRHKRLPAFSDRLYRRLGAATTWLWSMTDAKTGDAPNIGANDGARLLPLVNAAYRDFRPSIQLAAALFKNVSAYEHDSGLNASLQWLDVEAGMPSVMPKSQSFDHGGFHVLRNQFSMAVLRYPRFKFRPSQADALHLDFWLSGANVLRDAGTFSYNAKDAEWFSGTSAHNTVEFDKRDQMPRLGRFLFGDWLKAEAVKQVSVDGTRISAAAAYTDPRGAKHSREIELHDDSLICTDMISGEFKEAVLRWRLAPTHWRIEGSSVVGKYCIFSIAVDGVPTEPTINDTMESRFYQHKEKIPEAYVTVFKPATIVTIFKF